MESELLYDTEPSYDLHVQHRLSRGTEYMGTTWPSTGSSESQNTWELHDQAQALQSHRIHGNYTTKHRLFRVTEYMGTTRPSTGSSESQNISLQHGHHCLSRGMEYMAMTRPTKRQILTVTIRQYYVYGDVKHTDCNYG